MINLMAICLDRSKISCPTNRKGRGFEDLRTTSTAEYVKMDFDIEMTLRGNR